MPHDLERWDRPTEGDLEAYARLMGLCFGFPTEAAARWLGRLGSERARVILSEGALVAALASYDMGHFFGGRAVPCHGVAGVVVAPEKRRRGLAGALMREALREAGEQGVALASLFAANHPLYRGVGFERAGSYGRVSIAPDRIGVVERAGSMRALGPDDEPARRALYEAMARGRAGHLQREEGLWRRATHSRDDEPLRSWLAISPAGEPEGYLCLRHAGGNGIDQQLEVVDLAATSPWAVRRLLCFLGDHASVVVRVSFPSAPACPFLRSLPEPRVRWERLDAWLLRVVSLPAAVEARGWPAAVAGWVELDLEDPLLPANSGRWVLEVEGGEARVRRGGGGAVRLGPRGLATIYSGYVTPAEAAAAGLLEGPAEALATLASMFAGPAPWVLEMY